MTAFAWSAIATVFVFALSQIIQLFLNINRRHEQKIALRKSIFSETNVILSLISEAKSADKFEAFIKSKSIEQINAYSFVALQSSVYKNISKDLWHLDSETVSLVTRFYCLFDIFNGFIGHFKTQEFIQASDDIKSEMKGHFIATVRDLHVVGNQLHARLAV